MYMRPRVLFAIAIAGGLISTPLTAAKGAVKSQASPAKAAAKPETPAPDAQAFFKQYCVGCHNERNKGAVRGFTLDSVDTTSVGQHGEIWEKVVMKLRAGQMPPRSVPRRPDRALSDQVAAWLESELDRSAIAHPNPGRTDGLHRLNRTEYKNAVRDLLGLSIDVENLLPPDPLGGGDAN